jgi:hypothetical protein
MAVPFIAMGHSIVFPMRGHFAEWYETQVRNGVREVTVEIADRTFRGKAMVVQWQGVYDFRNEFSEKYSDLPTKQRKLDVPALAVDFDPWW